jgi:hypothetical protein
MAWVTRQLRKTPAHHDSVRGFQSGAGEMNRTPDLLITNELLYRLSYTGVARDYSVPGFGSFPMIPGAEFAGREFLHIKRTGGLVLILSLRSRRSAN